MSLGDAGAPNDDASYTGDTGESYSLQYIRNKASEFQQVMNQLDETQRIARNVIDEDLSPELTTYAQNWITEFEGKRWQFRAAAEAINAVAATINGVGGRFPQLSIPGGLGALPAIVIPAAVIGTIGALVVWGSQMIGGFNERLKQESLLSSVPEDKRPALAAAIAQSDAAASMANNPLSNVAGIVKWVAIGVVGFFAYKAAKDAGLLSSERKENPNDDGIEEIDESDDSDGEGDD